MNKPELPALWRHRSIERLQMSYEMACNTGDALAPEDPDLVGSTALAARLDLEDLRDIIGA